MLTYYIHLFLFPIFFIPWLYFMRFQHLSHICHSDTPRNPVECILGYAWAFFCYNGQNASICECYGYGME